VFLAGLPGAVPGELFRCRRFAGRAGPDNFQGPSGHACDDFVGQAREPNWLLVRAIPRARRYSLANSLRVLLSTIYLALTWYVRPYVSFPPGGFARQAMQHSVARPAPVETLDILGRFREALHSPRSKQAFHTETKRNAGFMPSCTPSWHPHVSTTRKSIHTLKEVFHIDRVQVIRSI
jgi:hypothetical protein